MVDFSEVQSPGNMLWSDRLLIAKEITRRKQEIDYEKIAGHNRLLLLGESHFDSQPPAHIAEFADVFNKMGFTHYCIEAPINSQPFLDKLSSNPDIDLSGVTLGPGFNQASYEKAVRALARKGIKIVTVAPDSTKSYTKFEDREAYIKSRVLNLLTDKKNRILVLIGSFHITKHFDRHPVWLGQLAAQEGTSVASAYIIGGHNKANPKIFNVLLEQSICAANLLNTSFMVDMRDVNMWNHDSLEQYQADYLIHLPEK